MGDRPQKEVKSEKQNSQAAFQKLFEENVQGILTAPMLFNLRQQFLHENPKFFEYILECALKEPHRATISKEVVEDLDNLTAFYDEFGPQNVNNDKSHRALGKKLMEGIYSLALQEPHYSRIIKNNFDLATLEARMGHIDFVTRAKALAQQAPYAERFAAEYAAFVQQETSHATASAQFGAQAEAARAKAASQTGSATEHLGSSESQSPRDPEDDSAAPFVAPQ